MIVMFAGLFALIAGVLLCAVGCWMTAVAMDVMLEDPYRERGESWPNGDSAW